MKKFIIGALVAFCITFVCGTQSAAFAAKAVTDKAAAEDSVSITPSTARGAYLTDYATGTVLYERDADRRLPIASMVKIMTLVLVFDNIESGGLDLNGKLTVSECAASMGGSQMFLDANTEYPVADLIKGIVVCSANDASVALAEAICGSKEEFVVLMNKKAAELNMSDTNFVNVTGLPQEGQYSTARDVNKMMSALLKNEAYYTFSGVYMEDYTHPSGRVTELVNTNKLIRFYNGCDAGKTGFTNDAMFCLSASAKRNGMRVVATVVGAENSKARFAEVSALFNYAFANYSNELLIKGGEPIPVPVEVAKAERGRIAVAADRDVCVLHKKNDKTEYGFEVQLNENLTAPIKKGEIIGKITVLADGKVADTVNIVALEDIQKLSYNGALREVLKNWFCGKRHHGAEERPIPKDKGNPNAQIDSDGGNAA